MKSFLTISLALLVLLQSFSRLWIVMDYEINKDFISKVLCINKAKPELQCEGKCHLAMQLEKEEQKEQQNPEKAGAASEIILYAHFSLVPVPSYISTHLVYGTYKPVYSNRSFSDIFHPPQFLS